MRWTGIGRPLQALAMSPFVRDRTKLRPLASKANQPDLRFLKELIEAGNVAPVVDRTYSLSETAEAMRHLEERQGPGKVVITV
jgi:NADPH:quinone reductase-like Zn-dependent oxidoreductase